MWEEFKKEVRVPNYKEKIARGLSDEEWILECYENYKDSKCFRELNGHSLCTLCPKYKEQAEKKAKEPESRRSGLLMTDEEIRNWLNRRK